MAVRIRLMRMGSKRRPFYRFVVADSRGKRDGGFLDQVGYYNPIEQPQKIEVDEDKVFDWLTKGAQLSDGARSLLKKTGTLARWDAKRTGREAPQKTLPTEEPVAAAAPAPEAPSEEVPAEEPRAEEAPSEEAAPAEAEAEEPRPEEKPSEKAAPAEAEAAPEEAPPSEEAPAEEKTDDTKETEAK
jgi:small subunit ribosomal protein S16